MQANAYVTPPQSQGFDDHYDVHDVFVLQVEGEKRWRIHAPVHEAPLRDQPWTDRRARRRRRGRAPEPLIDVVLRPGDCLYLPRGFLHAATALGAVSTHLTLGVHTWTRHALAEQVLDAGARDARRRRRGARTRSPLGADVADPAALADDLELVRGRLLDAVRDLDAAAGGRTARRPTDWPASAPRRSRRSPSCARPRRAGRGAAAGRAGPARRTCCRAGRTTATAAAVLRSRAGDVRLEPDEVDAVRELLETGRADHLDAALARTPAAHRDPGSAQPMSEPTSTMTRAAPTRSAAPTPPASGTTRWSGRRPRPAAGCWSSTPGPWAPDALAESGIDRGVQAQLRPAAGACGCADPAGPPARPARTPERGPRAWAVVDHAAGRPVGLGDLGRGRRPAGRRAGAGPRAGAGRRRPTPADEPVLLVCTHGRHDTCCALRGRPVAAALAQRWPDWTWECSHVGGDRFAANLVLLPDGAYYGYLDPSPRCGWSRGTWPVRVDAGYLRGLSTEPPIVQAAMVEALQRWGPVGARTFRSVHLGPVDGDRRARAGVELAGRPGAGVPDAGAG